MFVTGWNLYLRILELNGTLVFKIGYFRLFSKKKCIVILYLFRRFYTKIYSLYFVAMLLIYNEVYFQRLRSFICSQFYEKRQKFRILYLYNFLLKRRKKLFKYLAQNVKEKIREKKLSSSENILMVKFNYLSLV